MSYREVTNRAVAVVRERIETWLAPDAAREVFEVAHELTAWLSSDEPRRELARKRRELRASVEELLRAKADLEREIARREAVEAELRARDERLRAILENSPAYIYVKDRDFRYVQMNRNAESVNETPGSWIGRDDFEMFPADNARELRANDERVIATRTPIQVRETILAGGCPRHFLSVKFPLFDERGEVAGVGGISTDVTAMIAADEEQKRVQAKMQEAQKLESLGVLAGGIAHDFNNLLTGILGNVTLALFELGPRHRAAPLVEQIEIAALKASDLTRQLLAYAGKGKFVVDAIDLSRLLGDMSALLTTGMPKKVRFDLELAPALPLVEGDSGQLHQVVMNLVQNAAESIADAEGVVTVATAVVAAPPAAPPTAGRDGPLPPGRYVKLEVRDTGTGMDAATVRKIFDPFFTTKFPGRGLGLPAILGIVGAHRGAVYVRSTPGAGSVFEVYLPVTESTAARRSDGLRIPPELEGRFDGTILVVDDEPLSRTATASMLRKLGFRVIEAADGFRGVEAFRDHLTEVRLVLLDVTMPRMGGEEVLAAIRALDRSVPVIAMSGFSREDVSRRFGSLPPSAVLEKPFGVDELVSELRLHLEAPVAADVR